jgi:ribonuclease HI
MSDSDNATIKPQSSTNQEALQNVIERVKGYNNPLVEGEPIIVNVDGLCENPGPMHLGLWGHQGDRTLFAEHMSVGHGTCNEAEYLGVKCGLLIMQAICPQAAAHHIDPTVKAAHVITDRMGRANFAFRLNRPSKPFAAEIKRRLSADMQRSLATPWNDVEAFKRDLAEELDAAVHGEILYDKELFAGTNLRQVTAHLLAQRPSGLPLARLNRLLLEDAFPDEMSWAPPIIVLSDSQIVVHQVDGGWKTKQLNLVPYRAFLKSFRRSYYYGLVQVPREENTVADSLAQKYILKNSGRCVSLDNQRVNVSKLVPAEVKENDIYKSLAPKDSLEFLQKHNLRPMLLRVMELARDGDADEAIETAHELELRAQKILEAVPKTNERFRIWTEAAVGLLKDLIPPLIKAIEEGSEINMQYFVEEIAREQSTCSPIHEIQTEMIRNGLNPFQDTSSSTEQGEDEI